MYIFNTRYKNKTRISLGASVYLDLLFQLRGVVALKATFVESKVKNI